MSLLAWDFIEPYFKNIISLFDISVSSEVRGSSIEMRAIQFTTTFNIMLKSPFIGLGVKSLDNMLGIKGLFGAESIWMYLLIERGLFGVISYFYLILSILKIGMGNIRHFIWAMTIAWLTLESITSTPGIEMSFFLIIIFILNRIQILSKQCLLLK